MKSSSILGMIQVLKGVKTHVDQDFIWETTSIILLLIKEKNREIYKSVLQYLRTYIKITPKAKLQSLLTDILIPVFEWDEDARNHLRKSLRNTIEKFMRKMGRQAI